MGVKVGIGVLVGVEVEVGVDVLVGVGVEVGIGVPVGVRVGVGVGILVGIGVKVGEGMGVGVDALPQAGRPSRDAISRLSSRHLLSNTCITMIISNRSTPILTGKDKKSKLSAPPQ